MHGAFVQVGLVYKHFFERYNSVKLYLLYIVVYVLRRVSKRHTRSGQPEYYIRVARLLTGMNR